MKNRGNHPVAKELVKFLRREKCLGKFRRNIRRSFHYSVHEYVRMRHNLLLYDDDRIIRTAFVWDMTSEGKPFWHNIHVKWVSFCCQKGF